MPKGNALAVVILAAGSGKRLNSDISKVCHKLAGKPLIRYVIDAASKLSPDSITVVVGHKKEQVIDALSELPISFVEQKEQKGTAHAAKVAIDGLDGQTKILVLLGDVPLITEETLTRFINETKNSNLGLVLVKKSDPKGYGRVIRDDNNNVVGIVEEKDADTEQLKIKEVFTGILCISLEKFRKWYPNINNNNAQNEYYLPDLVSQARQDNETIASICIDNEVEIEGINTRIQLANIEKQYQSIQVEKFIQLGVHFYDLQRVYFRGDVTIGKDSSIDFNVLVEDSCIGNNVTIGPNCVVRNSTISSGTVIEANSYIDGAIIGNNCRIGPYARIRPKTKLHSEVKIGNFVEVKKSEVHSDSKINHLSYIGDTVIMEKVNVGAGTITCNYDGANKHQTTICENSFIGSGTQLVAPVNIGKNSTIGAGSTITRDTLENKLTLSRGKQKTISGWKRPKKENNKE